MNQKQRLVQSGKAYTLIEVLAINLVISILAAIVFPRIAAGPASANYAKYPLCQFVNEAAFRKDLRAGYGIERLHELRWGSASPMNGTPAQR